MNTLLVFGGSFVVVSVGSILLGCIAIGGYGLVLAFKASIILGIASFIIEPSPLMFGLLGICGRPEVPAKIAAWLHLPF